MKRYTGQQALYEAISRSRAKAKQGGILEKLRPEPSKPGQPAAEESRPPIEPLPAPEETPEAAIQGPAEPAVAELPPRPEAGQELKTGPVAETPLELRSEAWAEPQEWVEPSAKLRPIERAALAAPTRARTWLRPRPVQLNEGRIEVSVPYYVGVIAGLAVIIVVLAAFRLGQAGSSGPVNDAGGQVQPVVDRSGAPANSSARPTPQNAAANTSQPRASTPVPSAIRQDVAAARTGGDHCIVLAQYKKKEDLDAVVQHYAGHNIPLVVLPLEAVRKVLAEEQLNPGVLPSGDGYLLVTNDYVDNPKIAGTNGYAMLQRIIEVGALYRGKAPSGLERFAPNYFSDAYGMKVR